MLLARQLLGGGGVHRAVVSAPAAIACDHHD
jgi:hypothetical protein